MAITRINYYRDSMYQWQAQQLKATGSGASSQSVTAAIGTVSGGTTAMTSQVPDVIELTKYALDQMGASANSRVAFNQITRYREQLQSESNTPVRTAMADSGVTGLSGLSFELDKDGKLTALGDNAEERNKAQAWLDANPAYGKSILENLPEDAFANSQPAAFSISSTGKLTAKRTVQTLSRPLSRRDQILLTRRGQD